MRVMTAIREAVRDTRMAFIKVFKGALSSVLALVR